MKATPATDPRLRGEHSSEDHPFSDTFALCVTVGVGVSLAAQARVNGDLGKHTGAVMAAVVSFAVGTAILVALVGASARARAGCGRLVRNRGPAWWWLGGLGGAAVVGSSAGAVPEVGVSLVSVLIVAGATVGALLVDAVGLGPGGRVAPTGLRLAGVGLAIVAVSVGAIGQHGSFRPALLALVGIAGVASAGQQAANGQLREVTADARVAALVNFTVALVALGLLAVALAIAGHLPAIDWPARPTLYLGGVFGAVFILVSATLVRRLGVLRLTLGIVSGQVLGALLIDAVAPTPGLRLTATTVVGALLTLVAVGVTARAR